MSKYIAHTSNNESEGGPSACQLLRYEEISEFAYLDYSAEWENEAVSPSPMAAGRNSRSFAQMQAVWKEDETDAPLAKGFVPSTLFFWVRNDGRIIGGLSFRHYINDRLLQSGGHIGYGIRRSERRKGHARAMLAAALDLVWKSGLDKVLITCNDTNLGSARVIEGAGGILEDKRTVEDNFMRRYWLDKP